MHPNLTLAAALGRSIWNTCSSIAALMCLDFILAEDGGHMLCSVLVSVPYISGYAVTQQ